MNSADLLRNLRNHVITEAFHGEPPDDFNDDYDLIECGIMDSLLMMNLITHLTSLYSVEFGVNDLVPTNFHSITALAQFIESKS
jgi:acyl carrier protein